MAFKRKESAKKSNSKAVYQLKINLLEVEPPIWRCVLVSPDVTLGDLNYILQAAMGWTNSHLHQFTVCGMRFSDPRLELDEYNPHVQDEFGVTLAEAMPEVGDTLEFEYDLGDGWEHNVLLEAIVLAEPGTKYPICAAGGRACPPEDCGGVGGYEEFLAAISDPDHEEHDDYLTWAGGAFDPEAFDVDKLNKRLIKDVKLFTSWS